ncbi:BREX-1 system adenine-specific DNA-methyltransferase PglX [Massilia sp. TWR1-2-2]|uniref:BREX-1 system adenine-specific DNA-methyltransferase PglX n=1 Tax=Massilia sp. TWR1-2-2 TaxID=2804584 RepID=UPI003CFAAF6A
MNKAKLKSYAPQARKDFIAAVTARANLLGLSEKAGKLEVATSQPQGDATVIAGHAWPIKVHSQRQQLITRIQKDGFAQTMEAVAYTWFNRFAALRYMELHDYLGHGHRALSSLDGTLPDILTHAADLAQSGAGEGGLPGLKPALVVEMKLAGNRDGELYRLLLVAQCNALSNVMPFLFERIDDETELLLPDNLLRTDSVIAKLVTAIDEEDWGQVEIIGWLYQFYISEKKDEVIGKVVKSEDIPAATQLFTPNWIVQYLVQNSVGRLWLMANPASTLKAQWPYYIAPADQTIEVQAQLDALIQARVDEDGDSLNPESITLLDPACGSGHILVEGYDVLKAIYLERGYQPRAIPRLILEKNLYGLDIDDRAAQMAGFALLMKARADDRRLFNEPIKLNVLSLQESQGLDVDELVRALQTVTVGGSDGYPMRQAIASLIAIFANAKTFGSLIQIPSELNTQVKALAVTLKMALQNGDLYAKAAAQDLWPLVVQAQVLGMHFDSVVANPPYMGGKNLPEYLKTWAEDNYTSGKSDLFAMFILRAFVFAKNKTGICSLVTMQSWMFISTFLDFRKYLLSKKTINSLMQIGFNSFPEMNSKIAQACAFSIFNYSVEDFVGSYVDLNSAPKSSDKNKIFLSRGVNEVFERNQISFSAVPGSPIAYWASDIVRAAWKDGRTLNQLSQPKKGLDTGENERFLRRWHEVSFELITKITKNPELVTYWVPIQKGGAYRRWFGNLEYVVDWRDNGEALRSHPGSSIRNERFYGIEGATWSTLTSSNFAMRLCPPGFIFESKGAVCFPIAPFRLEDILAFGNSNVAQSFFAALSQTMDYHEGPFGLLPYRAPSTKNELSSRINEAVTIAKNDWDSFEESWEFAGIPQAWKVDLFQSLSGAWMGWAELCAQRVCQLKSIEEENNSLYIDAYGLQDELAPDVPENQITLARASREKDSQRLISYAIGCMMGRYSLDEPGLIYANSGNIGFEVGRHVTFPADFDGIVPLTDELWFEDEAASRITEFLLAVWGADTLTENMAWLAESLGIKAGETPGETIRRYLADKFYNDHLQTYKKRPIYWLFSSGKQGAFQALVYLHRYHEGTLARMRAEYVLPLTGKIQSRIDMLEKDAAVAASIAVRNKLAKEVEKLKKKQVELLAYDEKLRHHADMRISLDLDDGVKVNYGKFGDLLAEVKAITGGASDD